VNALCHLCSIYDCAVFCTVRVRLAGGSDNKTGRVEIKYNGVWGTVCANSFAKTEARVVCRMLRFEYEYFSSIRPSLYDTIEEFNVDSKAEYSALSSTRSQKKKLKQTTPVPL